MISQTFAFVERATYHFQVSLLDLTLEAGIPDGVMWSLIDGKHIVSVSYHDGLLVDRVNDGLDQDIDRISADFGMHMKNVTLAAYDRITKVVEQLSELMRKVNDRQTYFESVLKLGIGPT